MGQEQVTLVSVREHCTCIDLPHWRVGRDSCQRQGGGGGVGKMGEGGRKVQSSSIKQVIHGVIIYSMGTIIDRTKLYI